MQLEKSAFKISPITIFADQSQISKLGYDPLKLQKRILNASNQLENYQKGYLRTFKNIPQDKSEEVSDHLALIASSTDTNSENCLIQREGHLPKKPKEPSVHDLSRYYIGNEGSVQTQFLSGKQFQRSSPLTKLILLNMMQKLQQQISLFGGNFTKNVYNPSQQDSKSTQGYQEASIEVHKIKDFGISGTIRDHDHLYESQPSRSHCIFQQSLILEKNDLQKYQIKQQKTNMSLKRCFYKMRKFSLLDDSESSSEDFLSLHDDPNDDFNPNDWNCVPDLFLPNVQNLLIQSSNQDECDQQENYRVEEVKIEQEKKLDGDEMIILSIIQKSLSKKSSEKAIDRQDVIIKTIFRILRSFYKCKLAENQGKRRKKMPQPDILQTLDTTSKNVFKSFNVPPQIAIDTLSNYLGALIMPKQIQQMQFDDRKQMDIISTTSKNSQKNKKDIGIKGRERREERFKKIKQIAQETQSVLYKYNKRNLKNFFKSAENVCMLDYFLRQTIKVFKNYNQYASVSPSTLYESESVTTPPIQGYVNIFLKPSTLYRIIAVA